MATQSKQRKPAARKAAGATAKGRAKAAAARAEVQETQDARTVEWRGIEIKVPPPERWSSELYFLLGEDDRFQHAAAIIEELVGRDQLMLVRRKLAEDGVRFSDVPNELAVLFVRIMESYGMMAGESEASPGS